MRKLTREEFHDRLDALQRARRIFIESGLTRNISVAFDTYQELLAEQERKSKITKELADGRIGGLFDEYERPECPECGQKMFFRWVKDAEGINSQVVCGNPKCDVAFNSPKTIIEWAKELKKRNEAEP